MEESPVKIGFKIAEPEDKLFLARVCREANYHYSKKTPGVYERLAVKFEKEGLPEIYSIYLIQNHDENIGFLGFSGLNKKLIYLVGLYLLLDYQRQGYGGVILNNFLEELTASGYEEIILLAHKKAHWAITFYKNNRFELISSNFETTKNYAGGLMWDFALPAAVLMKRHI